MPDCGCGFIAGDFLELLSHAVTCTCTNDFVPVPVVEKTYDSDRSLLRMVNPVLYANDSAKLVEHISRTLSNICRFGGQTSVFYSVAEHSVLLADYVYGLTGYKDLALEALFHDAHEAFLGDIVRPIKEAIKGVAEVSELESTVDRTIRRTLGLRDEMPHLVSSLDYAVVTNEASQLLPSFSSFKWPDCTLSYKVGRYNSPESAHKAFLSAYTDWSCK